MRPTIAACCRFFFTCVLALNVFVTPAKALTLYLDTVTGISASQALVTLRAKDFTNLITVQGSFQFNPAVATFANVEAFGLPGMTQAINFNVANAASGVISFTWDDGTLAGVSLTNGTTLFQIRFNRVGTAGQQTAVSFINSPTPPLYSDIDFNEFTPTTQPGLIQIQALATPPVNDLCAGAILLACGDTLTGTTIDATLDAIGSCDAVLVEHPGVWYTYVGTGTTVTVSLECVTAAFDSRMTVYQGDCVGGFDCIGANEHFCGLPVDVTFDTQDGVTYYVLIHNASATSGQFKIGLSCAFAPNDTCGGAIAMQCGQTISGSTTDATAEVVSTCGDDASAPGVWYSFTGTGDFVTVSTCSGNTNYDTRISVYEGDCNSLTCVTENDDDFSCFMDNQSTATFQSTLGTPYLFYIHGFNSSSQGNFELSVTCETLSGICSFPDAQISDVLPPTEDSTEVTGESGVVTDMDVSFNITHPYIGDLKIVLRSPSGTTIALYNQDCGGQADINATFDDEGLDNFNGCDLSGNVLVIPSELLAAFDGEDPNGFWKVIVSDTTSSDDGSLISWCLSFSTGECAFDITCNDNDACTLDECIASACVNTSLSTQCLAPDNAGTADFPTQCPYHGSVNIIDGLNTGDSLISEVLFTNFLNLSVNPGGTLGGDSTTVESEMVMLQLSGTGTLSSYQRTLTIPVPMFEVHTAPRTPNQPYQAFQTVLFRLFGQIDNDTDFSQLSITAGSDFGLPSPGQTVLNQQGSEWAVSSFFDVTYRIDFIGSATGPFAGLSGSTTGTFRMTLDEPFCTDNNVCTNDYCVNGVCTSEPLSCVDGDACTQDNCFNGFCQNSQIECADLDACTNDTCIGGTCAYPSILCTDGDNCTTDTCIAGVCDFLPITCDTSDLCLQGFCNNGTCVYFSDDCNDNDACTEDICLGSGFCDYAPIVCDDANVCNGLETCDLSTGCVAGTPLVCNDNDVCTGVETCIPALGCAIGTVLDCDDNSACTLDDCNPASGCFYSAVDCNDNNACTLDSCNIVTGCFYTPVDCDDNDVCTGVETCIPPFGCAVGTVLDCDDNSACTLDSCNALTSCFYTNVFCDDLDTCTIDNCDAFSGCTHLPNPNCVDPCDNVICNDFDLCTSDVCINGNCVYTPVSCSLNIAIDEKTDETVEGCNNGTVTVSVSGLSCNNIWFATLYDSSDAPINSYQYNFVQPIQWGSLADGNYTIVVTDNSGCNDTLGFTIETAGSCGLEIANVITTNETVQGCNNGTAKVDVGGLTCNSSFVVHVYNNDYTQNYWGVGYNTDTIANISISNLPPGTYHIVATDGYLCADTIDFAIGAGAPCGLEITNVIKTDETVVGCNNGTVKADVGGLTCNNYFVVHVYNSDYSANYYGVGYTSDTTINFSISNLPSGNYHIVATDGYQCSDTVDFVIGAGVPCGLQITNVIITNETVQGCGNGMVTADVGGKTCNDYFAVYIYNSDYTTNYYGVGYTTDTVVSITNFPLLLPGDYHLVAADGYACTDTADFVIGAGAPCNLSINNVQKTDLTPGCDNDGTVKFDVTGLACSDYWTANFYSNDYNSISHSWSSGSGSTINWTGISAGAYHIVVFDNSGFCTDTVDVTISAGGSCQISITDLVVTDLTPGCQYGSISATFNGIACNNGQWYAYLYDDSYANQVGFDYFYYGSDILFQNIEAGTYHLVVTDQFCSDTTDITVGATAACSLQIDSVKTTNELVHGCSDGTIKAYVSGTSCQNTWSAYLYLTDYSTFTQSWSSGSGSPIDWTSVYAGAYHLVVNDGISCADTLDVTIDATGIPCGLNIDSVEVTDGTVDGCNDGSVSFKISGASCNSAWTAYLYNSDYSTYLNYLYYYNYTGTPAVWGNLYASTYHLVVNDIPGSCADTIDFVIENGTTPCGLQINNVLSSDGQTPGCGTFTADVSGTSCQNIWYAYLYLSDYSTYITSSNYSQDSIDWYGIPPGDYHAVVNDNTGICADTVDFTIGTNTPPCQLQITDVIVAGITQNCLGAVQASIEGTSCNNIWNISLYTSDFSGNYGGYSQAYGSPVYFTSLPAGDYKLIANDLPGSCTDTFDFTVAPDVVSCGLTISNLEATNAVQDCHDGSLTANVGGASCYNYWQAYLYDETYSTYTHYWSYNQGAIDWSNILTGNYHIVVNDAGWGGICADTLDVAIGTDLTCDDGIPCTLDSCTNGACAFTPIVCNDSSACTTDACVNGVCVFTPIFCSDGNVCNGIETCDSLLGCQSGTPLVCNDANVCNGLETCDPINGCVSGTPLSCDDNNACNGLETCNPVNGCVSGTPLTCDDNNACNGLETCNPLSGCVPGTPLSCDDANVCNGVETCNTITGCVNGTPLVCDDNDACNGLETCNPLSGCVAGTPVPCGLVLYLDTVTGASGSQVLVTMRANNFTYLITVQGSLQFDPSVASFANVEAFGLPGMTQAVNFNVANAALGVISFTWDDGTLDGVNLPNGATLFKIRFNLVGGSGEETAITFINNPTPPLYSDTLFNEFTPTTLIGLVQIEQTGCLTNADCNDNNVCTIDSCNGLGTCVNTLNKPELDFSYQSNCAGDTTYITNLSTGVDPNATYYLDVESDGIIDYIIPASTLPIDSAAILPLAGNINFTVIVINPGGCSDTLQETILLLDCNDNNACTIDSCANLQCFNTPVVCDDGDTCTIDNCDALIGCVYSQNPNCPECFTAQDCNDNDACTIDKCNSSLCEYAGVVCANDGNVCTDEICDSLLGCISDTLDCDDNNACTSDFCGPLVRECFHTPIVCVQNADSCTVEICDLVLGCISVPKDCSDSDLCTTDFCQDNNCKHTAIVCPPDDACHTAECQSGVCVQIPVDCNDGNPCTLDSCDAAGGCFYTTNACSDGDLCTLDGACVPFVGCPFTEIVCIDGDACTDDFCNPALGCIYPTKDCSDLNACTLDSCNSASGCFYTNVVCDDSNLCTTEVCDNLTGCVFTPVVCNDNNACNGIETCSPISGCVNGTPLTCNDNNACNGVETCDPILGCVNGTPLTCNDNNACNGVETCNPISGCVNGTPLTCNDNNACNGVETCDPILGCVNGTPLTCNDNNACNGIETCDPILGCVNGTPLTCSDNNLCNGIETCDPITGCVNGTPLTCNDNNACNGIETCNPISGCVNGTPLTCSDNNLCNGIETCDPITGCVNGTPLTCSDNNLCNGIETCNPITGCVNGTLLDCDDADFCTIDACDPLLGCTYTEVICNDNDACTDDFCNPAFGCFVQTHDCNDINACTLDSCNSATGCFYTDVICDDGDLCTNDSCNAITGCFFTPIVCNDGDPCTTDKCENGICKFEPIVCNDASVCTDDSCVAGICQFTPISCDDGNPCINDLCDDVTGCYYVPVNCNDGNLCTDEFCDATGACQYPAHNCDDASVCTLDSCNAASGCFYTNIVCEDFDACTQNLCDPVTGCYYPAVNCNDNNFCTEDFCDIVTGCYYINVDCNDFNACFDETCNPAIGCVYTPVNCNDNSACSVDGCDPASGCFYTPTICDDFNECTVDNCDGVIGCFFINLDCNDINACTTDGCDPASGCFYAPVICDDFSFCTTEACDPASGCIFTDVICDDNNICTIDNCNPSVGCEYTPLNCVDGSACTNEICDPSIGCVYTPVDCNDFNACTLDSCHSILGCFYTPVDCNDNNACTVDNCDIVSGCIYTPTDCNDADACTNDFCDVATGCFYNAVDCNDLNECTTDACNPAFGCFYTPVNCDDLNACTSEFCDATLGCVYNSVNCNDNNTCTIDDCNLLIGCVYVPVDCNDGNACTAEFCDVLFGCTYTAVDCEDFNPCTIDACDPTVGCAYTDVICDDFDPCTNDICDPLIGCVFTPIVCDDFDPCTTDKCEFGVCVYLPIPCDDGSFCTNDVCIVGICDFQPIICDDLDTCTVDACDPTIGCTYTHIFGCGDPCAFVNCEDNDFCTTDWCDAGTCEHACAGNFAHELIWQKSLGGNSGDAARSVYQTSDGGYIVTGYAWSTNGDVSGNNGQSDYWVTKLDGAGNLQWQNALGGDKLETAFSVKQTADGGYILAGSAASSNTGDVSLNNGPTDFWIVKLDATGNLAWEKLFGGSKSDVANSVQQTADGGYVVAGWTASNNTGDVTGNHGASDFWVIKLDASGNLTWQKALGGTKSDYANSVQQTADLGYIVAGTSASNNGDASGNNGGDDFWVVKLDASGNLIWQNALGGTAADRANSAQQTNDGGYIITGVTESNNGDVSGNQGNEDYWLVKLDAAGNLNWQKTYGGSSEDIAHAIDQTNDGGYFIAGSSTSNDGDISGNHGGRDFWVVKTDATGNTEWQKALGGNVDDFAFSAQQTNDEGYIIAGHTNSHNTGDVTGHKGGSDFWVVKLAADRTCVPVTTLDVALCSGESIVIGGEQISSQGTFYDTLTKANGCDSILIYNIAIPNCDDGNPCTVDDCANGICSTTPLVCNDGDLCTIDACGASGCSYTAINCNDNINCTSDECVDGTCFNTLIPGCNCDNFEVSIQEVPLPVWCQGATVTLKAVSATATSYLWSTGETTMAITANAGTAYSVTVTGGNGCAAAASATTTSNADLLSSYVILAKRRAILNKNTVFSGGVGVFGINNKADVKSGSIITATGTFVKADNIQISGGSSVTVQDPNPANVPLPAFEFNPTCGQGSSLVVPNNSTVTLNGSNYKGISIGKNATVTFTQSDINLDNIYTRENVTIKFTSNCVKMRICKKLVLGDDNSFNPDGKDVVIFVQQDVTVDAGSTVIADIYMESGKMTIENSPASDPTVMKGLFIVHWVEGKDNAHWYQNTNCPNECYPQEPVLCAGNAREVSSFTLVSAATESDIGPLLDGAVIDLSVTGPINIRANVCLEQNIESVKFLLNGNTYRIENLPFYTIAGDNNGNYAEWNVQPGVYTIRAIPYSGDNATGIVGTYHEVTITIVGCGAADSRVTSFTLINADTDADIGPLTDGAVIDLSVTGPINVRANVCDEDNVESVRFLKNGNQYRIESLEPYAFYGDNSGDYHNWTPQPGVYTIKAIPYDAINGTGTAGTDLSVTFTIIGSAAKMDAEEQFVPEMDEATQLSAYPNPFTDRLNIEFTLAENSRVNLEIFNLAGQRIAQLFEGNVKAGELQKYEFTPDKLADGMIIYRLQTDHGVFFGKAIVAK